MRNIIFFIYAEALIRLAIERIYLNKHIKHLGNDFSDLPAGSDHHNETIKRCAAALSRISKVMPLKISCLVKSNALSKMLLSREISCYIKIGAINSGNPQIKEFHAWVQTSEITVTWGIPLGNLIELQSN